MPTPIVAGIAAGGSLLSGAQTASAAKKAARIQAASEEKAMALQKEMFDRQVALQEPFRQAGITTQNELLRQMGLGGEATSAGYGNLLRDFTAADFQQDPGYAFRMAEGLKALDRQAAARGGLISGGALKASQRYGQDLASQEYQNAYNRYNQNRRTRYQMLTGQQTVGQEASGAQAQAAQNYGVNAGNALSNAAQARASGYLNAAQAQNALIGNLTNIGTQLAQGYGTTWGQYASPAASQSIASGWSKWNDPMTNYNSIAPTF